MLNPVASKVSVSVTNRVGTGTNTAYMINSEINPTVIFVSQKAVNVEPLDYSYSPASAIIYPDGNQRAIGTPIGVPQNANLGYFSVLTVSKNLTGTTLTVSGGLLRGSAFLPVEEANIIAMLNRSGISYDWIFIG